MILIWTYLVLFNMEQVVILIIMQSQPYYKKFLWKIGKNHYHFNNKHRLDALREPIEQVRLYIVINYKTCIICCNIRLESQVTTKSLDSHFNESIFIKNQKMFTFFLFLDVAFQTFIDLVFNCVWIEGWIDTHMYVYVPYI